MIKSKEDLLYFLKCDEIARFHSLVPWWKKFFSPYWKFNVILRKREYNLNVKKIRILELFYKIKMRKIAEKTGWYVEPNVFGPGLCIAHYGPVIVNGAARFGANCKIQAMVNIGASGGSKKAPIGGDGIYFGPGAKVFGNIELGSNIAIGANSVVNKSFLEDSITIAGVPAKKISDKGADVMTIDTMRVLKEEFNILSPLK